MLGIARGAGVIALLGVAVVPVAAGTAGNPTEGHRLALKLCSACHIVASDQSEAPLLRDPAPSFPTIANGTDVSANALQNFLLTIHRTLANGSKMPNPALTDDQAIDIAAYIMTLRSANPDGKN